MRPFRYEKAPDAAAAVQFFAQGVQAKYLGGGTNLVDLMRETVERPDALVDVTGLSNTIEETGGGGLLIGAAVRNTALAEHRAVRTRYPVLARAILAGASAQIRNMATVGGNLLQRRTQLTRVGRVGYAQASAGLEELLTGHGGVDPIGEELFDVHPVVGQRACNLPHDPRMVEADEVEVDEAAFRKPGRGGSGLHDESKSLHLEFSQGVDE